VTNRVHLGRAAGPPPGGELERLVGAELAGKVGEAAAVEAGLAERDRRNLAELKRKLHRKPLIEVPLLDADVHDLDGLRRMDAYLFDSEPVAQTGAE
jgi:hypothetical protein